MKPASEFSISDALAEYLRRHGDVSFPKSHDPELVRIAESLFEPNADRNTRSNRLTADARRKGGKNRWKATADSKLLADIVQQCEKKVIGDKTPERNINGYLYKNFCGAGKPGAGKISRERIRKITRIVWNYYASKLNCKLA